MDSRVKQATKTRTNLNMSSTLGGPQRDFLVGDTAKGSPGHFFGHQTAGSVQLRTRLVGNNSFAAAAAFRCAHDVFIVHGRPLHLGDLTFGLTNALKVVLVSLGENMFFAAAINGVGGSRWLAAHYIQKTVHVVEGWMCLASGKV